MNDDWTNWAAAAPAADRGRLDPVSAVRASLGWVLAAVLLGAVCLGVGIGLRPITWTAQATVLFTAVESSDSAALSGTTDRSRVLATQDEVVLGDAVVHAVATTTGLAPDAIRARLAVTTSTNDNAIQVSASGPTGQDASDLAAATTEAYVAQNRAAGVARLQATIDALQAAIDSATERQSDPLLPPEARAALTDEISSLSERRAGLVVGLSVYPGELSVLRSAQVPGVASTPSVAVGTALGGGLGLLLGVLLALYRAHRRRWAMPSPARTPSAPRQSHWNGHANGADPSTLAAAGRGAEPASGSS